MLAGLKVCWSDRNLVEPVGEATHTQKKKRGVMTRGYELEKEFVTWFAAREIGKLCQE